MLAINRGNFRHANNLVYTDNMIDQLIAKYGDFSYIARDYYNHDPSTIGKSFTRTDGLTEDQYYEFCDFYFHWRTFWSSERINAFQRASEALGAEYDPLSNYDKTSDIITGQRVDGDTTTTTPTGEKKIERTDSGSYKDSKEISGEKATERSFNNYTNTVANDVSTDESTAYRADTKSTDTQTGSYTDTESYDGYKEETERTYNNHKQTEKETYTNYQTETEKTNAQFNKTIHNDIDSWSTYDHVYERTLGNIGVTTSQQMLESEIELRVKNLAEIFVKMFVKEHLFIA